MVDALVIFSSGQLRIEEIGRKQKSSSASTFALDHGIAGIANSKTWMQPSC